ncbi:hypothetical protein [Albirhodobacter sp. R86504]|uniref:hypothetical protein n=1 Tax=Albirhodobacter sp. R86504 TaxID=3093848 RepID=UPI0036733F18
MANRNNRFGKGGGSKFVQVFHGIMKTPAWQDLSPTARALYVELKARFNGKNNGQIMLSHREAGALLNLHRNSLGKFFNELVDHGFIHATSEPHLGPSGIGQTTKWAFDEMRVDATPARQAFRSWSAPRVIENRKPRTKSVTPRPQNRDASDEITSPPCPAVINFMTHLRG